ncbi:GNAT family N-acetyltransferase [Sutcliffiella cohnii]|uniref:GNAT family N-acetyltransferase n=1 Tax=Sutcliffiella cohnii TaxID=33932 RepID=A0A223KKB5_9BACI|nr:GNAT family N-acetyltransferase [Sutcliffiella cohnii]AST89939.1 GNAT family N-acetyltransferase [Sutcliffiella cohnii]
MVTAIRKISKEEAWKIRHKVMWPDKPFEYIKLKDDDAGIHFGLFNDTLLIAVVSLFVNNEEAQFRKFATLLEEQGKGYGTALLKYVLKEAEVHGVKRIWCNARQNKADFYSKFGLDETSFTFIKGGKSNVIMEKYL